MLGEICGILVLSVGCSICSIENASTILKVPVPVVVFKYLSRWKSKSKSKSRLTRCRLPKCPHRLLSPGRSDLTAAAGAGAGIGIILLLSANSIKPIFE